MDLSRMHSAPCFESDACCTPRLHDFLALFNSSIRPLSSALDTGLPPLSNFSQSASAWGVRKGFGLLCFSFTSPLFMGERYGIFKPYKKPVQALGKFLQNSSTTSMGVGIRASNVVKTPSLLRLQAIFNALVWFVNPMKRITLYPSWSKYSSSATEYPSMTSSSSLVHTP